jgi:hypothetical protein
MIIGIGLLIGLGILLYMYRKQIGTYLKIKQLTA